MASDLVPFENHTNLSAVRAGTLDYPTILKLGEAFAASGMWKDVTEAGVAAIKIMAGAEMGLEPVAAMNGIDIIPGTGNRGPRMRPNADVQAWLAARAGFTYKPLEHDDTHCKLQWFENGQPIGTSEFSLDSAKRAGLVKEWGAWKTWPENMVLSRAVTQGVKLFCRHVLAGKPGGLEVVTTDEYEQEYPDPRDDLVRALHAAFRKRFPKRPEEDAEEYRNRRLDWSNDILSRNDVWSWNGPDYPETLTRADVQTLLAALEDPQTAPDSSLDEGAQADPQPRFGDSINPAWGKRPAKTSVGTRVGVRPEAKEPVALSGHAVPPVPAGFDCGHICCAERHNPGHDHFLTPEQCPQCNGPLPFGRMGPADSSAGASRVAPRPDRIPGASAPAEPLSAGDNRNYGPEGVSSRPDVASTGVSTGKASSPAEHTPDEGEGEAPDSAAGEAREDRGREAAAPPEPTPAQEAGLRMYAGKAVPVTPKPRRRPPVPSVAQVREAQQAKTETKRQYEEHAETDPLRLMEPAFKVPFLAHFDGNEGIARKVAGLEIARLTRLGEWTGEWTKEDYDALAAKTFERSAP